MDKENAAKINKKLFNIACIISSIKRKQTFAVYLVEYPEARFQYEYPDKPVYNAQYMPFWKRTYFNTYDPHIQYLEEDWILAKSMEQVYLSDNAIVISDAPINFFLILKLREALKKKKLRTESDFISFALEVLRWKCHI